MDVRCKYTLSYGCGPAVHCVWAALCFVDVKTTLLLNGFILSLFLLNFLTNDSKVSSLVSSPSPQNELNSFCLRAVFIKCMCTCACFHLQQTVTEELH